MNNTMHLLQDNIAEATSQVQYNDRQLALLKKANLIGSGIRVLMARVSEKKRDKYDETTRMWSKGEGSFLEDRRDVVDIVTPIPTLNGEIAGDWRRGLTKDEIRSIIDEFGVRVYLIGKTYQDEEGRQRIIEDTKIQLFHGKTYNLAIPAQLAEYNIVKYSSLIAPSKELCYGDDNYSFYWYDEEKEFEKSKQEVNDIVETAQLPATTSLSKKKVVAWLLYYFGHAEMDKDNPSDKYLQMVFDLHCVTKPNEVKKIMAMNNKEGLLYLHQLMAIGRVQSWGKDGPYHAERSSASEERGALIGETMELAAANLFKVEFQYLLSYVKKIDSDVASSAKTNEDAKQVRLNAVLEESIKRNNAPVDQDDVLKMYEFKKLNKTDRLDYLQKKGIEVKEDSTNGQLEDLYSLFLDDMQKKSSNSKPSGETE